MKRTTVSLPDELDQRLRLEARLRNVPLAEIVRQALDAHLRPTPRGGRLSCFGVTEGGPPDASDRVDEYVTAAVRGRAKRRGQA